jgi:tetratricopeptide (TPR) repeat protein
MIGRRILFTAAAVVTAAGVLYGGVLAGQPSSGATTDGSPRQAAGRLLAGFSPGDTAGYIARLEDRVSADPEDGEAFMLLGLAYQQRVRENGDPSLYARSEEALRRALRLDPRDDLALTGLATLAATRHRFRDALHLARRALAVDPKLAAAHGIRGDALVELGRYRAGFAAFDRMAALKPNLAAYARVAYARELLGRTEAAVSAMKLAASAGSPTGEDEAWARVELGNLYYNSGRLRLADRAYREALARFPGYHRAQGGLARAAAARGRTDEAVALYQSALDTVPLPEYASRLAETLSAAGRARAARKAYGLLDVMERLFEANGVRTELETALVDLDRGRNLADALARAREAHAERRSIDAEDVLAWALYRNGRCGGARRHSELALRLGTRDALKLFHRGLIERCLGDAADGRPYMRRALAINPYFSLRYAQLARRLAQ